jgi:hypoxanthine phosphoribosyltransferase
MSEKIEKYTWGEFEEDCKKIAGWASERHVKNVYGIPRGGLVVAVKLSHLLDIPLVLNREDISRDTLIVDDIIDEGNTLERLLAAIGEHHHIASLFYNKTAKHAPHFFAREKKSWVLFPWETEQTSKYDLTI